MTTKKEYIHSELTHITDLHNSNLIAASFLNDNGQPFT